MDLELTGKRALVTGSSSGIGVGIAQMLADEGASVVVHGRNAERATAVAERIAASGAKAAVVIGTLSTDESAQQVAEAALAAFGGIDILVNNAGGSADLPNPSWFQAATSDWMDSYQANVLAAVRLVHHLVPGMQERGWGRVINIGTGASITPTSAQPDYGPAKAAMLNMSLGLSKALKRTGITCNTVSPGMIRTEGLQRFLADFAAKRGWDDIQQAEDYVVKGTGQTVVKVGEPADIAYAVTMLASPRSDFVNGANLHVDGGISPSIH
ncbi:MAG TPA: SDR family NAD(P)-dependent oxidoreductase [Mycobacteriales bacterium]|nr:SDR family NAD(P)-dependent oxidoreductase [Mycobacteriales bacterium]